ncbi:hypothetical protein AN641_00420 [Candidatus Epulonipiscioides gigas]|nr:hypothetical protein AN641_00420 [Epulopiscium sp. SCG-C07WGA-EpuloA2]
MRSVWPCLLADYMCMCSMNESQKLREHHQTHLIKEDYRKKKNKEFKIPYTVYAPGEGKKAPNVVETVLSPGLRQ